MIVSSKSRTLGVRAAEVSRILPYAPPATMGDTSLIDAACATSHFATTVKGVMLGGVAGVLLGLALGAVIAFKVR